MWLPHVRCCEESGHKPGGCSPPLRRSSGNSGGNTNVTPRFRYSRLRIHALRYAPEDSLVHPVSVFSRSPLPASVCRSLSLKAHRSAAPVRQQPLSTVPPHCIQVLNAVPTLTNAAVRAVRRWKFYLPLNRDRLSQTALHERRRTAALEQERQRNLLRVAGTAR